MFSSYLTYICHYFHPTIFSQPMKIEDLLSKPVWTRRVPGTRVVPVSSGSMFDSAQMTFDSTSYYQLGQSDFLDELNPTSHNINSVTYRSNRLKFKYNPDTQANVADGYDPVERVAIAMQMGLRRHKVTHTFGNQMWFGPEGKDDANDELVSSHCSHWSMAGMTDALNVWGSTLFGTADAAIYLYKVDGHVEYKIFSYEKGDVFNMTKDDKGNDVFVRMLSISGVLTVEVYGKTHVDTWVKKSDTEKKTWPKVPGWIQTILGKNIGESEDGYVQTSHISHGLSQCPVMYWRIDDVVWGPAQNIIDRIESILSDLGENNKYYAYQILFLAGGVMNLPPVGKMGKTIAAKSTDAKAEILQPADASNTFTIDLDTNFSMLWETTGTVVLEPKDLNGGDYSGAFIKNLYFREVQWSLNMIAELRPAFARLVSIFDELVGQIEAKPLEYNKIKMSFKLEPYVPKNLLEEVTMVTLSKSAGLTSVKTGSGEMDFNNPREYELIKAEEKEKADAEAAQKEADAAKTAAQAQLNVQTQTTNPVVKPDKTTN